MTCPRSLLPMLVIHNYPIYCIHIFSYQLCLLYLYCHLLLLYVLDIHLNTILHFRISQVNHIILFRMVRHDHNPGPCVLPLVLTRFFNARIVILCVGYHRPDFKHFPSSQLLYGFRCNFRIAFFQILKRTADVILACT